MRGKFCMSDMWETKTFATNDEYREYLRKKDKSMRWIVVVGILLAVIGFWGEYKWTSVVDDYMLGVYAGVGCGLIIAGIMLGLKHRRIMKDEVRLKKARLEASDERVQEIGKCAFRMAAWIMIIAMYAISLIGGLWYPILTKILLVMVCVFLLAYMICYRVYEKKM